MTKRVSLLPAALRHEALEQAVLLRGEERFRETDHRYRSGAICWSAGGSLAGFGLATAAANRYGQDMRRSAKRFTQAAHEYFASHPADGFEACVAPLKAKLEHHLPLQSGLDALVETVRPLHAALQSDPAHVGAATRHARDALVDLARKPGPLLSPRLTVIAGAVAGVVLGNRLYHACHRDLAAQREQAETVVQEARAAGHLPRLLAARGVGNASPALA